MLQPLQHATNFCSSSVGLCPVELHTSLSSQPNWVDLSCSSLSAFPLPFSHMKLLVLDVVQPLCHFGISVACWMVYPSRLWCPACLFCSLLRQATLPSHQTVPSTTPYYKVLQSATSVLFCTTKYYSSTTLYYKVLVQYYLALQSTPSTTSYYKVLLQYC